MQLRKFYNPGIGRSSFTWQKQSFSSTHGMKDNSQVPWDSELSEPGQRKVGLVFLGGGLAAEEQEVAVSGLRPCWGGRSSLVVVQTMRASRGGGCPSLPGLLSTSHPVLRAQACSLSVWSGRQGLKLKEVRVKVPLIEHILCSRHSTW